MKRVSYLSAVLASCIFVAACNDTGTGDNMTSGAATQQSITGEWHVESMNGQALPENSKASLNFGDDGTISGNNGCNRYSGKYTSPASSSIELGPLISTRRACVPPLGQVEAEFGRIMQNTVSYQIGSDGVMTITSADGQKLTARRL